MAKEIISNVGLPKPLLDKVIEISGVVFSEKMEESWGL